MEVTLSIIVALLVGTSLILGAKAHQLETIALNPGEKPAGMNAWLP